MIGLEKSYWFSTSGRFFVGFYFFLEFLFTKTNLEHNRYLLLRSINASPPQVQYEIACCQTYRGDEGKEADQDENQGGFCYKFKFCRDGV